MRTTYEKRKYVKMKLSDYLQVNQITQAEFAARIGTTGATVNRIVRGKVIPRRALMTTISEATKGDVKPLDLLPD